MEARQARQLDKLTTERNMAMEQKNFMKSMMEMSRNAHMVQGFSQLIGRPQQLQYSSMAPFGQPAAALTGSSYSSYGPASNSYTGLPSSTSSQYMVQEMPPSPGSNQYALSAAAAAAAAEYKQQPQPGSILQGRQSPAPVTGFRHTNFSTPPSSHSNAAPQASRAAADNACSTLRFDSSPAQNLR